MIRRSRVRVELFDWTNLGGIVDSEVGESNVAATLQAYRETPC